MTDHNPPMGNILHRLPPPLYHLAQSHSQNPSAPRKPCTMELCTSLLCLPHAPPSPLTGWRNSQLPAFITPARHRVICPLCLGHSPHPQIFVIHPLPAESSPRYHLLHSPTASCSLAHPPNSFTLSSFLFLSPAAPIFKHTM